MTNEEKQLLIKDLCARVVYGVCIGDEYGNKWKLVGIETDENTVMFKQQSSENLGIIPIEDVKPYLRPMTDMTENERWDYDYKRENHTEWEAYDYLNSIHIDYRGLIGRGLALKATDGMYNFKHINNGKI